MLDPLELVHAVVTQIPDAKKHLVRYHGAYRHRFRGRVGRASASAPAPAGPADLAAVVPAEPG